MHSLQKYNESRSISSAQGRLDSPPSSTCNLNQEVLLQSQEAEIWTPPHSANTTMSSPARHHIQIPRPASLSPNRG